MKPFYIVSFTEKGAVLGQKIKESIIDFGGEVEIFAKYPCAMEHFCSGSITSFTGKIFDKAFCIIFIGATGIAVRAISPFLLSKTSDPAVIVVDDTGKYIIPILSGHIGGGNRISQKIADIIGGEAVITTATDRSGLFSPDGWAESRGCSVIETELIKLLSAEILKGNVIGFQSDYPIRGEIPKCLDMENEKDIGIFVTHNLNKSPYQKTLHIVPRTVVLGIGCKRRTKFSILEKELIDFGIKPFQVVAIASIDLKAQEPALLELADKWNVEFLTYKADTLMGVEGDFTSSSFVQSVTGVDNVCERAAVKAAGGGEVIIHKTIGEGIAFATACRKWECHFEEIF